jgi:hypothetical protein
MLTTIIAWINRKEQSVESILSGYYKAVADLEAHASAKAAEVTRHAEVVAAAEELSILASREVTKATEIATKLKGIFS